MSNDVEVIEQEIKTIKETAFKSRPPKNGELMRSTVGGLYRQDWYNPDEIQLKYGGIQIYKTMDIDSKIKGTMRLNTKATMSFDSQIVPASKDKIDIQIAKEIEQNFERILLPIKNGRTRQGLRPVLSNMFYSAKQFGYCVAEINLEIIDGLWQFTHIKPKYPDFITFKMDDFDNLEYIEYGKNFGLNLQIPIEKCFILTNEFENGNWYGESEYRAIYPEWYMKTNIQKFRNSYLEKRGHGVLICDYDEQLPDVQYNKLLDQVKSVKQNYYIMNPAQIGSDFSLKPRANLHFLEMAAGNVVHFENAINNLNIEIGRKMLLPDKLGFTNSDGGSYALGQKHFDLYFIGLKDNHNWLSDNVTNQLIDRWVEWNYGSTALRPYYRFNHSEMEQAARTAVLSQWVSMRLVNEQEDWVREYLAIPEKKIVSLPAGQIETEKPETELKAKSKPAKMSKSKILERFDFKATESMQDEIVNDALNEKETGAVIIVDKMRNFVLDYINSKGILKTKDTSLIERVTIKNDLTRGLKDTMHRMMVSAFLAGKKELLGQAKSAGQNIPKILKFRTYYSNLYFASDLDTTKKFIKETLEGYGLYLNEADLKTLAELESRASFIAGSTKDGLLTKVREILVRDLLTESEPVVIQRINALFDAYRQSGANDGGSPDPYKLNTIVKTNTSAAFNASRMNLMTDPDLKGSVRAAVYSAILDDVTTDYCRGHDNEVLSLTNPEFGRVIPGMTTHWNCRSEWLPIFEGEDWEENWDYSLVAPGL